MTRIRQSGPRRWWLLAIGALLALPAASARAQTGVDSTNIQEPVHPAKRRGFQFFGLGDFAMTGMRQGGVTYWKVTSNGPSDDAPTLDADLPGRVIGTASSRNGYCCGYFELQLWMTAARGDWARARDLIPSLENVKGGIGWNSRTQLSRWVTDPRQLVFSGRDASVGSLFSGVTSESNTGSCRDNNNRSNDFIGSGFQLLAGSDCPPTWAGPAFAGERVVPDTVWLQRFQALGNAFTWEDYKVPASQRDPNRLYGGFQTFGATNDFGKEVLAQAGNVVPGGTGKPVLEGYPMGIEWEFNAWSYQVPSLGDAMFYKATIINKSAQVYGRGIDYDSISMGFMVRPFHTTNTQAPSVYAVPERGLVFSAQSNINATNCYAPTAGGNTKGTTIRTCLGNTAANRGFNGGAGALVILQSPIGDLRNKKFTDPTSPFYAPTHPRRGDTLTFNLMTTCGFTCATQQITPGHVRAVYGALNAIEQDAIAGRGLAPNEFTQTQYHDLFRNPDWPTRWSSSTGNAGGFARYVPPGGWDWNHDGVLDTLKVTSCWNSAYSNGYTGTPANGCTGPWVDTVPGGFPNNMHNNYFVGSGPVKLKAGDSTSYIVAFLSAPDSISIERTARNVLELYQSFWLSPQPPIAPKIVSASVVGGSRQFDTEVRLFLDQSANLQTDPFLLEAARKLKASTLAEDIRLRVYNPQIVNDIRARALPLGSTVTDTVPRDTLPATVTACSSSATYTAALCQIVTRPTLGVIDSVFVFKSCDGGATYTTSTSAACTPSPARDVSTGSPGGYAWQSYARLTRDASGRFPSQFRDGSVTGGVTYTYVVTAQSYPASFQVVDVKGGVFTNREYVVRARTQNGLTANTANPNVAVIYVPASAQAGAAGARIVFDSAGTRGLPVRDSITAFGATARLARPVRGTTPLTGRAYLSDSAEVLIYDSDSTAAGIDSTVVRLFQLVAEDTVTVAAPTTSVSVRRVGNTETFTVPGPREVDVAARLGTSAKRTDTSTPVAGKPRAKITRYNFSQASTRRPQVTLTFNGVPTFITDTIPSGADLTPAQTIARPDFNGLLLTFDTTRAGVLNASFWRAPGIPVLLAGASPTLKWLPGTSRDPASASRYRFDFIDTEFGKSAPFTLDPRNPQALRDAYTESVVGRGIASTTDVSAASATALTRALGRTITTDSLVALSLPFTAQNLRYGRPVTLVALKSTHLTSALLGSGGDTVRVPVPATKWIPGDPLYFVETLPALRYDTLSTTPLIRRVRRTGGVPDTISLARVTWGPTRLGCDFPTEGTCNPIQGFAGTGYTLVSKGEQLEVQYYAPAGGLNVINFTVTPDVVGADVATVSSSDLSLVKVAPNPYIMYSEYEQTAGTKRLLFTSLPPRGTIRIYTASGQFVQQIVWTEGDLDRNCHATTSTTECMAAGDLAWNMRTRENLEIGPGFYVFVVSTNVGGSKKEKLGKFVVIH